MTSTSVSGKQVYISSGSQEGQGYAIKLGDTCYVAVPKHLFLMNVSTVEGFDESGLRFPLHVFYRHNSLDLAFLTTLPRKRMFEKKARIRDKSFAGCTELSRTSKLRMREFKKTFGKDFTDKNQSFLGKLSTIVGGYDQTPVRIIARGTDEDTLEISPREDYKLYQGDSGAVVFEKNSDGLYFSPTGMLIAVRDGRGVLLPFKSIKAALLNAVEPVDPSRWRVKPKFVSLVRLDRDVSTSANGTFVSGRGHNEAQQATVFLDLGDQHYFVSEVKVNAKRRISPLQMIVERTIVAQADVTVDGWESLDRKIRYPAPISCSQTIREKTCAFERPVAANGIRLYLGGSLSAITSIEVKYVDR